MPFDKGPHVTGDACGLGSARTRFIARPFHPNYSHDPNAWPYVLCRCLIYVLVGLLFYLALTHLVPLLLREYRPLDIWHVPDQQHADPAHVA